MGYNVEISKKRDIEFFLENLKFKYRENFYKELDIQDILYFCSLFGSDEKELIKHINDIYNKNSKLNVKDYYDMLFKGIYPSKICPLINKSRENEQRKAFLEDNYLNLLNSIDMEYGTFDNEFVIVDGLNQNDMKYLLYAYLLPINDMRYINSEIDKSYVDLNALMNNFAYRYRVSNDELASRLNEVNMISSKEYTRRLK